VTESMTCSRALLLLAGAKARDGREFARARRHADTCPRCGGAYSTEDAFAENVALRRPQSAPQLRVSLLAVAAAQLVVALPWLVGKSFLPDAHVAVSHLTRDGALGVVIAALGGLTAWRPRYVHATMAMGLLVFAAQLVGGLTDRSTSAVSAPFELVHSLVVLILFGLFAVAADMARRATPDDGAAPARSATLVLTSDVQAHRRD